MPEAHQARIEIACSSCHESVGISFACGNVRAMKVWIATFSVSMPSSVFSAGTLPRGLTLFRYSGLVCSPCASATICV